PHIENVRMSGLLANHFGVLERLTRGEEVPLVEIASLHSRMLYVEQILQQAQLVDQPHFQFGPTPERRLQRTTGQIRPSILPSSLRPDSLASMTATYGRSIEASEVPTKHVRAAILFTDFSQFSKQSKGAKSQYIIDRLNRYFEALIPIAQKT